MFLNYFNVLILKIILKNKKNIILIYFRIKNILLISFTTNSNSNGSNTNSIIAIKIRFDFEVASCRDDCERQRTKW